MQSNSYKFIKSQQWKLNYNNYSDTFFVGICFGYLFSIYFSLYYCRLANQWSQSPTGRQSDSTDFINTCMFQVIMWNRIFIIYCVARQNDFWLVEFACHLIKNVFNGLLNIIRLLIFFFL